MNGHSGVTRRPRRAGGVERARREEPADAVALERVVDLGVGEDDAVVPQAVLGEAGELVADVNLEALLGRVVDDSDVLHRRARRVGLGRLGLGRLGLGGLRHARRIGCRP